jgi:hypothetical protein
MKGKCALYDFDCDLQKSHIIPKFVFKYFTASGSKYIRGFANPNQRLQDLDKMDLLSLKAENKFSIYEKWFAENIFKPYQITDLRSIHYNENLYYFVISVLWRVIHREIKFREYADKPFYTQVLNAEKEWKDFLSDYKFPSEFNRIHILLTDRIMYHDLNLKNVDYYMSRCIDSTIVFNPDGTYCFIYAKFLKFVLFGYINGGENNQMLETKINPIKGVINVPQHVYDQEFLAFFINRITGMNSQPEPSTNQQKIINDQFYKEYPTLKDSEAWDTIMNDWNNLDPR